MPLWSNSANSVDAPQGFPLAETNATSANLYINVTSGQWIPHESVGVFGYAVDNVNHTTIHAPGWYIVRHGTGPITTLTAGNGVFANGETFTITGTNATSATGTLTTNATGNLVTATLTSGGGGFANAAAATVVFTREKHIANVTVSGTTAAFDNTDFIICSNGSVNAVANVSTNATGGITNSSFTITNVGLFPNTFGNSNVVVTAYAANGATSNGTGATFNVKVAPSTGGVVTVTGLGGRAGRVQYECTATLHLSNSSGVVPSA